MLDIYSNESHNVRLQHLMLRQISVLKFLPNLFSLFGLVIEVFLLFGFELL